MHPRSRIWRSAALRRVRFQIGECLLDRVEVGVVGREEQEPGADALDGGAYGGRLVARQIVHHDDVATAEFGHEHANDVGRCGSAFIGPSRIQGATMLVRRKPATKVVVFQCSKGMPTQSRGPRWQRPYRRAMLVLPQVSSMKSSLSGSRSS